MTLVVLTVVLLTPAAAPPVPAMAVEVQGKVELQPAKGKARILREGDWVYPGDRLGVPPKGQVVLFFQKDGHSERLKPNVQATVAETGCTPAEVVERLKGLGSEKKPILDGLKEVPAGRGTTTVLRSAPPENKLAVTPIDGARVLTDQPAFAWPPNPKATTYRVEVTYATGRKVWSEKKTADPRLAYPADEKPLRRGREYVWKVLAENKDEVRQWSGGRFFVPEAAEAEEMEKLRPLATGSDPALLFLAGVTYEAKQYDAEALAVFKRLCRMEPNKAVFHAFRATLYQQAGWETEAKTAWATAEKLGFVRTDPKANEPGTTP